MSHRAMFAMILAAACALPAPARPQPPLRDEPPDEPPVAFVGVSVLPMEDERVLADHTVVTLDGEIVALGPADRTEVPLDAIRIDGTGRFLVPGLVDASVRLAGGNDLLLHVANGVTVVRVLDASEATLSLRDEVARGRRLGPAIVAGAPTLDSSPPTAADHVPIGTPSEARAAVVRLADAGYDFVRVSSMLEPEVYAAVLEAAREAGVPVSGDAPSEGGIGAALTSGQSAIDHASQYVFFHFGQDLDRDGIPQIAESTRRSDVAVATALSAFDKAVRQMGSPAAVREILARPEMRFVAPSVRERWGPANPYVGRDPSTYLEAGRTFLRQVVFGLQAAGARLVLGTDANEAGNIPGFAVHDELAALVEAGLTPYQALRAATVTAAEHLGMADEIGTIAVGKRADLVLLEGDPFADVGNAARRAGVMVGGHWITDLALRHYLDQVADSYAAPPVAELPAEPIFVRTGLELGP